MDDLRLRIKLLQGDIYAAKAVRDFCKIKSKRKGLGGRVCHLGYPNELAVYSPKGFGYNVPSQKWRKFYEEATNSTIEEALENEK